jgi:hypothetical protein
MFSSKNCLFVVFKKLLTHQNLTKNVSKTNKIDFLVRFRHFIMRLNTIFKAFKKNYLKNRSKLHHFG